MWKRFYDRQHSPRRRLGRLSRAHTFPDTRSVQGFEALAFVVSGKSTCLSVIVSKSVMVFKETSHHVQPSSNACLLSTSIHVQQRWTAVRVSELLLATFLLLALALLEGSQVHILVATCKQRGRE